MTCEVRNKEINSQCAELLVRPLYLKFMLRWPIIFTTCMYKLTNQYRSGDILALNRSILKLSFEAGDSSEDSYTKHYVKPRKRRRCDVQDLLNEQPTQISEPSGGIPVIVRPGQSNTFIGGASQLDSATDSLKRLQQRKPSRYLSATNSKWKSSGESTRLFSLNDSSKSINNEKSATSILHISLSSSSSSTDSLLSTNTDNIDPSLSKRLSIAVVGLTAENLDIHESETFASSSTQSISSFALTDSLDFKPSDVIRSNDSIYNDITSEKGSEMGSDTNLIPSSLSRITNVIDSSAYQSNYMPVDTAATNVRNKDFESGTRELMSTSYGSQNLTQLDIGILGLEETDIRRQHVKNINSGSLYEKNINSECLDIIDINLKRQNTIANVEDGSNELNTVINKNETSSSDFLDGEASFIQDKRCKLRSRSSNISCEDLFNTTDQSDSPNEENVASKRLFDWSKISQLSTQQLAKRFDFYISDSENST